MFVVHYTQQGDCCHAATVSVPRRYSMTHVTLVYTCEDSVLSAGTALTEQMLNNSCVCNLRRSQGTLGLLRDCGNMWQRQGASRQLLLLSMAVLVTVAFGPCTAVARPMDLFPRMLTATPVDSPVFPACFNNTSCNTLCHLCPYQCVLYGNRPTCTNAFSSNPPIINQAINSITVDNDLCRDWAGSGATFLGPMYTGVSILYCSVQGNSHRSAITLWPGPDGTSMHRL